MGLKQSKVIPKIPEKELTIFDILSKIDNNIYIYNTTHTTNTTNNINIIQDTQQLILKGCYIIKTNNFHPIIKQWLKDKLIEYKTIIEKDIKKNVDFNISSQENAK